MWKKMVYGFLIVLLCSLCVKTKVNAEEIVGKAGDNISVTYTNGVLTLSGTGDMNITMSEYRNLHQQDTTSIVIKEGITGICNYAFSSFDNLESVSLPGTLKTIGTNAFSHCSKLTEIVIPNLVTSIPEYTFSGCSALSKVTLPQNLISIGQRVFYNCSSLESINIPNGVTDILPYTFYCCSSLKSITLPNQISSIGDHAFYYCRNLQTVNLPENLKSIATYGFAYCSNLHYISLPNGLESIGKFAFTSCQLYSVVVPPKVSLGANVFSATKGMAIAIPSSVVNMDTEVFSFIENTSVIIYADSGSVAAARATAAGLTVKPYLTYQRVFPDKITLNKQEINLLPGMSYTLNAEAYQGFSTSISEWSSSNPSVASVEDGTVTVHKSGTAEITAVYAYDHSKIAQCLVNGIDPGSVTLTLSQNTVKVIPGRSSAKITAKINGVSFPCDIPLTWSNSNSDVATVQDGVISLQKLGSAVIKACYAYDASLSASCTAIGTTMSSFSSPYNEIQMFQKATGITSTSNVTSEFISSTDYDCTGYTASVSDISQFMDENGNYCTALNGANTIYIRKYNSSMQVTAEITIPKKYPIFGAVDCDKYGNYYIAWGQNDSNEEDITTICISKYSSNGQYIASVEYTGYETGSYGGSSFGTRYPFHAANCDLTIRDSLLVCYFGREMYNGHQSCTAVYVNTDMMEKVTGSDVPYQSHSFDQQVLLTSSDGFLFAGHGDAYNRGFDIELIDSNLSEYGSFTTFHFREGSNRDHGYNETYAQLGGIAETTAGYVLVASSEKTLSFDVAPTNTSYCGHSEARNLFLQIFDKNFNQYYDSEKQLLSEPTREPTGTAPESALTELFLPAYAADYGVRWLTNYSDEYYVQNPKVVVTKDDRIVILWEKAKYDIGYTNYDAIYSNYITSYYMILSSTGEVLQEPKELPNIRMTGNEEPVLCGDYVCWSTTNSDGTQITSYQLYVGKKVIQLSPLESALFDASYYAQMNPDLVGAYGYDPDKLLEHWVNNGIAEGRVASRVFDVTYYLENNKDLAAVYGNDYKSAYEHFVKCGCNELRASSKTYSGYSYKTNNSDLANMTGEELLIHYVKYGYKEGRIAVTENKPEPILEGLAQYLFDPIYYAAMNPDVAAAVSNDVGKLKQHWIDCGITEGRVASRVFDAQYYLKANPDLAELFGNDYKAAYEHFIRCGCNELRASSETYNGNSYKTNYSDLAGMTGEALLAHYVTCGYLEGRSAVTMNKPVEPTPTLEGLAQYLYDPSYYAAMNPDVAAAFGNDAEKLKQHWINCGIAEGRVASRVFNVIYYLETNPDLAQAFGNDYKAAYEHFVECGCKELRTSSETYNSSSYKANYSDLSGMTGEALLIHYVTCGYSEGRLAVTINKPVEPTPTLEGLAQYLFDPVYYAAMNPDVAAAVGNDEGKLKQHWIDCGIAEGRVASRVFDVRYYLKVNPDVAAAFGNNYKAVYEHFIECGCNELRASSENYSGYIYKLNYSDLSNMTGAELLIHFVTFGYNGGRNAV